jgi:hypothetical protein
MNWAVVSGDRGAELVRKCNWRKRLLQKRCSGRDATIEDIFLAEAGRQQNS